MKKLTHYFHTTPIPWRLLAGISLISVLLLLCLYATPPNSIYSIAARYLDSIIYPLFMALLCFRGAPRLLKKLSSQAVGKRTGQRFVPILLGTAVLCITLSQFVWLRLMFSGAQALAFPSLAYFLALGMYPFLTWAFLLLPSHHLSVPLRLRIVLDSLMIMTAVVTYVAYFLLAPLLATGAGTLLDKTIASINPAADLILLFCLLLVTLRSREAALRPVLIMQSLATVVSLMINVSRLQAVLHPGYDDIYWNGLPWVVSGRMFMLIITVGAAQTIRAILSRQEPNPSISIPEQPSGFAHWKILLIGGLILACGLLAFTIRLEGVHEPFAEQIAILSVGGFMALLLLVLRQFFAVYEVRTLQTTLQQKNHLLSLLNAHFTQQAITDPLTNLLNHRALVNRLESELTNARLRRTCCSIIFIDIDHFKDINDAYGHQTGDAVLHDFGMLMKSLFRETDAIGRWGGEEFIAVLPGEDQDEALHTAEHVRQRVEQQHTEKQALRVTCSLGVATYPHDAIERSALILSADAAMYVAKRLGRNQTRVAHEPMMLAMEMVAEVLQKLEEEEMLGMVQALVALQETRHQTAGQHARDVALLSIKLAQALGLSEPEAYLTGLAGLLHDLGMVTLPDTVLFKQEQLTAEEQALVAKHPLIGADALNRIPALNPVAMLVRAHHEHIDGSGYPDGLKGEEIPLGARILAVADAYDNLTAYHHLGSPAYQLDVLRQQAGSQFDPQVVAALARLFSPVSPSIA